MAVHTSFGNGVVHSRATTPGSVEGKKTQGAGGTRTEPTTDPLDEIPGTEPEGVVVVDRDADTHAIGHAASKLNDPPVEGDLGPSTTWSLPAWENVRTGLCTVATAVVGGAGMAAAMAADKHADLGAKVLLPVVAFCACGVSGWLASHACPKSTDD